MHTYLVICGYLFNLLVVVVVILVIIGTTLNRQYKKQSNAERYLNELKYAYKQWRAWAKKRRDMQESLDKTYNAEGRKRINAEIKYHDERNGSEYFVSKKRIITLAELAKQHGWVLEEQADQLDKAG